MKAALDLERLLGGQHQGRPGRRAWQPRKGSTITVCERGVPMWCGGMLETGIGRAHNIHVATMPGFVYPGDTASASRTYARDITEQALEATDGIMPVPPGAGHRCHPRSGVPRDGHRVGGDRAPVTHRVP